MKGSCLPRLATPTEVARILGVPLHRVEYVLRSRHIHPRAIAVPRDVLTMKPLPRCVTN